MSETNPPSAASATNGADVQQQLIDIVGDTGGVENSMGGFRIKVYHTRAFPWEQVFKLLLYRDFKVDVTRHKADLYIEARL